MFLEIQIHYQETRAWTKQVMDRYKESGIGNMFDWDTADGIRESLAPEHFLMLQFATLYLVRNWLGSGQRQCKTRSAFRRNTMV